jgi:hypothetical protein
LKYYVFSHIINWKDLIIGTSLEGYEPINILQKIYSSPGIEKIFNFTILFNTPAIQYYIVKLLSYFTCLRQLNEEYYNSLIQT